MNHSQARNAALPAPRQLPLPFPDPMPCPPPTQLVCLSPQQLWATLPLPMQLGVRTTLLRVFQEVLNDRSRS